MEAACFGFNEGWYSLKKGQFRVFRAKRAWQKTFLAGDVQAKPRKFLKMQCYAVFCLPEPKANPAGAGLGLLDVLLFIWSG